MSTQKNINTQATRPTLLTRWLLWVVGAVLLGVSAGALPACTRSFCTASGDVIADQDGLLEVGQSFATGDLSLKLTKRYGKSPDDNTAWVEVLSQVSNLFQSAGRLQGARMSALTGSRTEREQFYAQLGAQTAALRAQREKLEADLFKLLNASIPAPSSSPAAGSAP